jgi:hypothetical protein
MMFGAKLLPKRFTFRDRDSSVYAALRGGSEDESSSPSEKDFEEPVFARKRSSKAGTAFSCAVILLLVSTNVLTFVGLLATKHLMGGHEPAELIPKSAGMSSTHVCYHELPDDF